MFLWKISVYPASALIPSWIRAPPESLIPITGAPIFIAWSITLHIFKARLSESEPPKIVKSCAKTYTSLPFIVPYPVTTPSPRNVLFSIPKLVQRCVTNMSYSSKLPSSSSMLILSRAVYFPFACCESILFRPPPMRAFSRRAISAFTCSSC